MKTLVAFVKFSPPAVAAGAAAQIPFHLRLFSHPAVLLFFPQAEMRSHFNPLPIIQSLLLLLLPLKSITIFWKVHSIETYRQEGKAWLRAAVVGVISISVAASSSRPAEKLSSTTPFSSSIYYYYILPFYALALAKIEPEGEDEARQPQE